MGIARTKLDARVDRHPQSRVEPCGDDEAHCSIRTPEGVSPTFREGGIFREHLATHMRDDLVTALDPVELTVTVKFNSRGGIVVTASSSHSR
jgi:QueF-like protein